MFLALSGLTFAVFAANVMMGAFTGHAFLGDVGEMLVLFATSIFFVVAILKKEADRKKNSGN